MASVVASAQQPADTAIRQVTDTLARQDTVAAKDTAIAVQPAKDSVSLNPNLNGKWTSENNLSVLSPQFTWEALKHHPYFGFGSPLLKQPVSNLYKHNGKDLLFYLLVFLFIVFGIIRSLFPKYFSDLFRVFFRTTLKQKQIREQLMQVPLPSVLLNGFFVLSGAFYISFMVLHFKLAETGVFWQMFLYAAAGLSIAYMVKFIGLKLSGWLFNMKEAAEAYIFIVFIINKMVGILLLPFLLVLAFSKGNAYTAGLVLSWCLVGGMVLYRVILTYGLIRSHVKVNLFHFLLYMLAFEVLPVLIVYKALLLYFSQTA